MTNGTSNATIRVGDIVAPTNRGAEFDWTQLRGRVVALWTTPGTMGEPVADVRWTNGERYFGHARTTNYPVAMLRKVGGA